MNLKTDWLFNVKEFGAKGNAKYRNPANGQYYQDSAYTLPADDDTAMFNLALLASEEHTGGNNTPLKRTVFVPAAII